MMPKVARKLSRKDIIYRRIFELDVFPRPESLVTAIEILQRRKKRTPKTHLKLTALTIRFVGFLLWFALLNGTCTCRLKV